MAKRFPTEVALYEELKQACPSLVPETECEVEYIEAPIDAQGNVAGCNIYGHLTQFAQECYQKTWEVLAQFKFAPCILVQIKLSHATVIFETIADNCIEGDVSNLGIYFIEVTTKDQRAIAAVCQDGSRFSVGDFCALNRSTYMTIDSNCIPPDPIEPIPLPIPPVPNSGVIDEPNPVPNPYFDTQPFPLPPVPNSGVFDEPKPEPNPYIYTPSLPLPPAPNPEPYHPDSYQQAVAYLLNQPVDWSNIDVEAYPRTLGENRLPTISLRNLSKYNESQTGSVMTLLDRYTHWRKSRGDGNCYYRSVVVAYLEHLCRRTTHASELNAFYLAIFHQTKLSISAGNASYIKYFLKKLKELYTDKQSFPSTNTALIKLQALLQDPSFDQGAVVIIRSMASFTFHQLLSHPEFAPFFIDSPDEWTMKIETLGVEAEGTIFAVMANALNAKIVHIILDPNYCKEESFTPYTKGQRIPVLHVLLRPGHYDMLYSARVQLIDQYFYNTNSFLDPLLEMQLDDHDVWQQV